MLNFAENLSDTAVSEAIRFNLWVIPWIQIVHITAMAVVMSSVFMICMRIVRLAGVHQSIDQVARRFMPFVWGGLVVMAISGALLIVGEPVRSLVNAAFWIKMGLLATGVIAAGLFHAFLRDVPLDGRRRNRMLAVAVFLVWCGVIVSGRWIAYAFVPPA